MRKKIILILFAAILLNCQSLFSQRANENEFFQAVKNNEISEVENLIRKGIDVNIKNRYTWTALHYAARENYPEIAKLVISKGAKVNVKTNDGFTPLMVAAYNNNVGICKILFDSNADTTLTNNKGLTAYGIAQEKNNINILNFYKDPDKTYKNYLQSDAFFKAIEENDYSKVKEIIDRGFDINFTQKVGFNGLQWSLMKIDTKEGNEIALMLIDKGIDLHVNTNELSTNALILAAGYNKPKIVKELIERGVGLNMQSNSGNTALTLAVQYEHYDVCKLLIANKADTKIKNNNGETAYSIANKKGNINIIRLLENPEEIDDINFEVVDFFNAIERNDYENVKSTIDNGFNINHINEEGYNGLEWTILKNQEDNKIAEFLINKGIDISTCKNTSSANALILCAGVNNTQIAELLIEKGISLNEQAINGNTALILATKNNYYTICKLLILNNSDTTISNNEGKTAYSIAKGRGYYNIVELFENRDRIIETEKLFDIVKKGDLDKLKRLLPMYNINITDYNGGTLLHCVAETNNIEIANYLLTTQINNKVRDIEGNTAADIASRKMDKSFAQMFWYNQTDSLKMKVQIGHSKNIDAIAVSNDDKFLATVSQDNTAKLWDIKSHREIYTLQNACNDLDFSPDNKHIATCWQSSIKIFDVNSGNILYTIQLGQNNVEDDFITSVVFSNNMKYIIASSNKTYFIYNLNSNKVVAKYNYRNKDDNVVASSNTPFGHVEYVLTNYTLNNSGNIFAFRTSNNNLYVKDVETGKAIFEYKYNGERFKEEIIAMTFGNTDSILSVFHSNGLFYKLNIQNNKKEKVYYSSDEQDFYKKAQIEYSKDDNKLMIITDKTAFLTYIDKGGFTSNPNAYFSDFKFLKDNQSFIVGYENNAELWQDINGVMRPFKIFSGNNTYGINSIVFNPQNKSFAYACDSTLRYKNINSGSDIHEFHYTGTINSVDISKDGNYLAYGGIIREDLTTDTLFRYRYKEKPNVWNLKTQKIEKTVLGTPSDGIYDLKFHPNNNHIATFDLPELAAPDFTKTVNIYSLNKERIDSLVKVNDYCMAFAFNSKGEKIAVLSKENMTYSTGKEDSLTIFDFDKRLIIKKYQIPEYLNKYFATLNYNSNDKDLAIANYGWELKGNERTNIFDLSKEKFTSSFSGLAFPNNKSFSNNGKYLATGYKTTQINLWDFEQHKLVRSFIGHDGPIKDISFSADDKYLLTGAEDKTARLWDVETGKEIASFISLKDKNYAIVLPDNYYMITKGAVKGLHFVKGADVFLFDQFDVKYNRPDIVLERLGSTDKKLIADYRKAYNKRLEKLGVTEKIFSSDFHTPEISILNKSELPYTTTEKIITLRVQAVDTKVKISRLNVWINDVAIYGTEGIDLKKMKTKQYDKQIELELMSGNNKIQVSCFNENATESYKETIEIVYEPKNEEKPNLYILGIGVSEYENLDKLPNTDNDIRDLIELYKTKQGDLYNKLYIDTIMNEAVLNKTVISKKQWLNNTKVNDIVIVYFSGHGFMSAENDYYLGTYDISKSNITQKGLKYEEIENLLNGIPARRKLSLINACHSGEYDKDTTVFRIMQETYPELRRGTGAMTIASSYSDQSSYTASEMWKGNSAFGFVLEELLKKNKTLTINDLHDKLIENVSEQTEKAQKPTFRNENIEMDFRIW